MAFFSAHGANPDRVEHLHATGGSDGAISLLWEDATNGGDRDFDDAVLSVKGLKRIDTPRFVYQAEARDLDGDAVTYRQLQGPAGATISATTGLLSWNNPTVGSHTFRLVADDGQGATVEQQFTLVVAAPQPIARGDSDTTSEGKAASGNVLVNDQRIVGEALRAQLVQGPSHGKLNLNTDGSFAYTPAYGFHGDDGFSYRAVDSSGKSTAVQVKLVVTSKSATNAPNAGACFVFQSGVESKTSSNWSSDMPVTGINLGFGIAGVGSSSSAINWNGGNESAATAPRARRDEDWLSELLGRVDAETENLAQKTGLVIRL